MKHSLISYGDVLKHGCFILVISQFCIEFSAVDAADSFYIKEQNAEELCPDIQTKTRNHSTWLPYSYSIRMRYKENHKLIEGWMHECAALLVAWLTRLQIDMGVVGSVGEIGVHHGKFFLALTTAASPSETFWAIDVFSLQHLNTDGSGKGDLDKFMSNLDMFGVDSASVRLYETSSDELSPSFFFHNGLAPVRMASIDGGHSAWTTYHDLVLISCALPDGGIVIIDDYFNHGWPGVTDGLFRFLHLRNHSLAPFLEVDATNLRHRVDFSFLVC
jgi:hypothetical protein